MNQQSKAKTIRMIFLIIMLGMIGFAVLFQDAFLSLMKQPALQSHALFLHITAASLFFANAVIGMIWERRSLASGSKEIVLHTYRTVTVLDALFSSPLIILTLLGGLALSLRFDGFWQTGWLSVSFLLFILSGLIWVVSDIPTQSKVKRLLSRLIQDDQTLSDELVRLLKRRWWIGIAGVLPLVAVFVLMVYKPDIPAVADWFS